MNLIKEITALQEAVDKQWYVTIQPAVAFDDKVGYDRSKVINMHFTCASEKEAQALMNKIEFKIISFKGAKGEPKKEIISAWCKKMWPTFAKLTSTFVDLHGPKITNKKPGAKSLSVDQTFLK